MFVLCEMPAQFVKRVGDTGAIVHAEHGVVAGDEFPFAHIVLSTPRHAGCGIDRAQDFLSIIPRREDVSAFDAGDVRVLIGRVRDRALTLGRNAGRSGHEPARDTSHYAAFNGPTGRECGDDVPEVFDDTRSAEALDDRRSLAEGLERSAVILAQLSVVQEDLVAGIHANHQREDWPARSHRDPTHAVRSRRAVFNEQDRFLIENVLGQSAARQRGRAEAHGAARGLRGDVASSAFNRAVRQWHDLGRIRAVNVFQPIDDRLCVALFEPLEILLPEIEAFPVQRQVALAYKRPAQLELLRFVSDFLVTNKRGVIRAAARADIRRTARRCDWHPSFFIGAWLTPQHFKR